MAKPGRCFAYYCSGHGYGHATRVSALACHLLRLDTLPKVRIHIVSSAPQHVFSDSIAVGALYRFADIDPVIVQPLAYRVDRQKSVDVLKYFLSKKQSKLEIERQWLMEIGADCVLSDAAFLGCLAAKAAGLPSILVTNFTFDSVFSYLSTPMIENSSNLDYLYPTAGAHGIFENLVPDLPVPLSDLTPLVDQIQAGYRCADILFLLPGYIPIPSFSLSPPLPSYNWVDPHTNRFRPEIIAYLTQLPSSSDLHPPLSFPTFCTWNPQPRSSLPRTVLSAPLLVRLPTANSSVYTITGRTRFLSSIGVPAYLHDPIHTKILVVSFGGHVFRRPPSRPPSRPASRSGSRPGSHTTSRNHSPEPETVVNDILKLKEAQEALAMPSLSSQPKLHGIQNQTAVTDSLHKAGFLGSSKLSTLSHTEPLVQLPTSPRLATPSHIWIPGAPPASKPLSTPSPPQQSSFPTFSVTLSTPTPPTTFPVGYFDVVPQEDDEPRLLPDSTWVAIVCGVSKEQWNELDSDSELPEGFFVAPRDVYMPDLMAVADVLLGKLGYGTVSECVDSCSPFVYVSRPLFIEEHGLRLLLDREGVGVELSRQSYEEGDWAGAVEEAWLKGWEGKSRKRREGAIGIGLRKRDEDGMELARKIVSWVGDWWAGQPEKQFRDLPT